ncbi:MAG: hypothetical protein HYZ63_03535 [Candidatus Andersenbacteria bacterium]|nr:hypothetical protein [Candidatus Andersenbacteria bacterium]
MSSSTNIDSLSGLVTVVRSVEASISLHTDLEHPVRLDRTAFEALQDQINALQVCCPNHKGVVEARVWWYRLGVDNFEVEVVRRAERGEWPYGKEHDSPLSFPGYQDSKELLAGPATLEHFLKRHYLKRAFAELLPRVVALFRRIEAVKAERGSFLLHVALSFGQLADSIEADLLEGRL